MSNALQFSHTQSDSAHLIESSEYAFAISSPELRDVMNAACISVNGQLAIIQPALGGCEPHATNVHLLTHAQLDLIRQARARLHAVAQHSAAAPQQQQQQQHGLQQQQATRYSSIAYSWPGYAYEARAMHGLQYTVQDARDVSIHRLDEHSYSATKPHMAHNLARVFVHDDLVTFVHTNGAVLARPRACLPAEEAAFLHALETEIALTEQAALDNASPDYFDDSADAEQRQAQRLRQLLGRDDLLGDREEAASLRHERWIKKDPTFVHDAKRSDAAPATNKDDDEGDDAHINVGCGR